MKQGERAFLDDNGNLTCKDGESVKYLKCISCDEYAIAKDVYTGQAVVCPHCNDKLKVRFYKDGSVNVSKR